MVKLNHNMADQALVTYIKQNLAGGFSQNEIRTALLSAGWTNGDIEQAFTEAGVNASLPAEAALPPELSGELIYHSDEPSSFLARHHALLITLVALIILLPILAYGGYWAYQRFSAQEQTAQTPAPAPAPPAAPKTDAEAASRDRERLKDIESLQEALASFFTVKKSYPKLLDELIAEKFLAAIPLDPKSNVPYLYSPLGDPPLDFSLSFILETDVGTLKKGLNEISPVNPLKTAAVQGQDDAVKGITAPDTSPDLQITDLALTPFYPEEEVSVAINSTTPLEQVFLLVNHLKLADEHFPFNIRFTAPKIPGEYPVQIFGFTREGSTLSQTTKLIVKP